MRSLQQDMTGRSFGASSGGRGRKANFFDLIAQLAPDRLFKKAPAMRRVAISSLHTAAVAAFAVSFSAQTASAQVFELDTSSLTGCNGTFASWNFNANTPNLPGGFTYVNTQNGTREDNAGTNTNASAFYFGGWTNTSGGVWDFTDGILQRDTALGAPNNSGAATPNQGLPDFLNENNTPQVDTTYVAYRYQAEPNTTERVTIQDPTGLEHQMFAALDAAGNVLNSTFVSGPVVNSANNRYTFGAVPASSTIEFDVDVPASGEFFVHIWKVDMDQASGTAYPDCGADLQVIKGVAASTSQPVDFGDTIPFEITVNNAGPQDATNVSLTDLLPAGVTLTEADVVATQGSYDSVTGIWDIGDVEVGETFTLTLPAVVTGAEAVPSVTNNTTTVTMDQVDLDIRTDDLTER